MAKLTAPNYTQLPNALIALIPFMGEAETKIAIIIARETFGWHRPKVKLSLTDLMEHTGLTKPGVIKGIKAGIERGIVGREKAGQGFLYFLIVGDESQELPAQVVNDVDQRRVATGQRRLLALVNDVDQQLVNGVYQHEEERNGTKKIKETHTHNGAGAPVRARVGSKFSPQDCQRYARSLKAAGLGIINPGGYATVIFRSGEADALIEEFLNPARAPDLNKCPDCGGGGFYYPQGIGNGPVAKCKHEKLKQEGASA